MARAPAALRRFLACSCRTRCPEAVVSRSCRRTARVGARRDQATRSQGGGERRAAAGVSHRRQGGGDHVGGDRQPRRRNGFTARC
eukprot:1889095-Prymnesium_polylepis.2